MNKNNISPPYLGSALCAQLFWRRFPQFAKHVLSLWVLVMATGCASMAQEESVVSLRTELADLRAGLEAQASARDDLLVENVTAEMDVVKSRLNRISSDIKKHCKQEVAPACESSKQVVMMQSDKMIVGELEHVWIDPPGVSLIARIDTGAQSSSLHAQNIMEFERDGAKWVRFDVQHSGESITLERPVEKYVRVLQQSDREGTRRAVVNIRIFLGNVQETFEFTLADRSHLQHALILGRNFLTDIALVDVAKQYIQPKHQPKDPE